MNTNHHPSLELCKELTEIGFPRTKEYAVDYHGDFVEDDNLVYPSVMEMLDVMPKRIVTEKFEALINIKVTDGGAGCHYKYVEPIKEKIEYEDDNGKSYFKTEKQNYLKCIGSYNLPNTLAEMILWLHENNYISFSK